ncbi:MAG: four helix bundle protein [Candidatus Aenigmatarchaeota archaeon]
MYTKLFQKCYDLIKYVYPLLNKFPKSQRLILSQRIENTVILLLDDVTRLNYKDSNVLRKNISMKSQRLQILFRVSKDLSFLRFKQYEHLCKLLEEIRSLVGADSEPL